MSEDGPDRLRDVRWGERGGCDLVQQWLKEMKVIVVDDEHVGGSTPQLPSREQPTEAAAHNDDAWTPLTLHCSSPGVIVAEMGVIMAHSKERARGK